MIDVLCWDWVIVQKVYSMSCIVVVAPLAGSGTGGCPNNNVCMIDVLQKVHGALAPKASFEWPTLETAMMHSSSRP